MKFGWSTLILGFLRCWTSEGMVAGSSPGEVMFDIVGGVFFLVSTGSSHRGGSESMIFLEIE